MSSATITRPNLAENLLYYRAHPPAFVRDHLGAEPDPWQEEVLAAFPYEQAISIVSGNGVGKTALTAWLALHGLVTSYASKTVLTAPTSHQLHDNLWAELARWYGQSTLGDIVGQQATRYYIKGRGEEWFIVPRSTNKKENFQGYHAPNVFFFVDEASGVAGEIYEAIEGGRATDRATVTLISNPTRLSGYFYDTHHKAKRYWRTWHIDSEDRTKVRRVNQNYIEEMAAQHGRSSPLYLVKVRGIFPPVDEMSAVPRLVLEAALERRPAGRPEGGAKQMGVDPARFGPDSTGIVVRLGQVIAHVAKAHGLDGVAAGRLVEQLADQYGFTATDPIQIDTIGVGASVVDYLTHNRPDLLVIPVNSAEAAKDPTRYHNTRTEMYLEFGKAASELAFTAEAAEHADEILEDLTSAAYGFDPHGRFRVEPKDHIKSKIGRSPDLGDAVLLATYIHAHAGPLVFFPGAE